MSLREAAAAATGDSTLAEANRTKPLRINYDYLSLSAEVS